MMIKTDETALPIQENNSPSQKRTSLRWGRAWITICLLLHIGILQIVVNLFLPAGLSLIKFPLSLAPFFLTGLLVHFLPPAPTRAETALGIALFSLILGVPGLLMVPSVNEIMWLFEGSARVAANGALFVGSGMVGHFLGSSIKGKRSSEK